MIIPTDPPTLEDVWSLTRRTGGHGAARSLVQLSMGIGNPIFIIHWGSGNIRFLQRLTGRMLGANPVYGLEAVGVRTRQRPFLSVNEMARHYLSCIRSVQPHEPYFLIGLCSGSQVAYEIARRLTAAGERVALLAAVNGVAPGTRLLGPSLSPADIYDFRLSTINREFGPSSLDSNLPNLIHEMKKRYWLDEEARENDFYWHQSIWTACFYAQENYAAQPYDCPLYVFKSACVKDLRYFSWESCASRAITHALAPDNSVEILQDPIFCEAVQQIVQAAA